MKYNRKQLREHCGNVDRPMPQGTLRSAISRGKVVVDDDGLIDDQDPINAEWIKTKVQEANSSMKVDKVTFNARKAELETQKLEEELRVARIKRQKMEGEVIPTDMAKNIFRTHFKNLKRTMMDAAEQMAVDVVKMLGGNNDHQAKAKEMLAITINKAAEQGVAMSESDIRAIVEEYSENGGKGR